MNDNLAQSPDYANWVREIKTRIRQSQIKASLAVNHELISLHWDLGKSIITKQAETNWGDGLINQLASSLKSEFPDLSGFSRENLYYMKRFYVAYNQPITIMEQLVPQLQTEKMEQPVPQITEEKTRQFFSQIPWGHHVVILKKIKKLNEAIFYIRETITNNWSRAVLQIQIESNLFERQGKAVTNFAVTLPKPQSDLAIQLLKDPYNFNFLTLEKDVQELELERQLVKNITQFLLELGKGFAYLGRQYILQVGTKEYRLDLLFYHVRLRCYVVIELKTKEFEPEFVGKLNFYLSAIDSLVKEPADAPTIGMLLCKTKDNLNVEFSLRDINKPIGVSEFTFNELPQQIQNAMPTVEELERELFKDDNNA